MQRVNLVPRALFPLTSRQKMIALGASISGIRMHAVNQITRIRLFPLLYFKMAAPRAPVFRRPVKRKEALGMTLAEV